MESFIIKDNKKLRYGYTTGSCAAAATKAALIMLFEKVNVECINLMTPKGILLNLKVYDIHIEDNFVSCAIKKNSGDDPDITNGILIYSKVQKNSQNKINIIGGIGVGKVTKKGLEQPVGQYAINSVPRKMIKDEVSKICNEFNYKNGVDITIFVPNGEDIAKKTFNPKLGIIGGISILGTTGIVEPMSEEALKETIHIEIKMKAKNNYKYIIMTPGNYGETFIKDKLQMDLSNTVKCSNYIGNSIDYAIMEGIKGVLFIGHIGKFVKLAAGIMNTHSKNADARAEIMTAYACKAGANRKVLLEILDSITTDDAIKILKDNDLLEKTMGYILERIYYHLKNRSYEKLKIGVITFSNKFGILGSIGEVEELKRWYIS